jgi:small GTP-binding protein
MAEKTIFFAPDLRRKEFLDQVQKLDMVLNNETRSLLGASFGKLAQEHISKIRACLNTPFKIAVLGDFKRGKSTLVNALLTDNVLPTSVAPETITFNRIVYGDKKLIIGYLKDGRQLELSSDELHEEKLNKILQSYPLDSISISYPFQWLNDVELVDTPGLGDLLLEHDTRVENYIKSADVVIYVISVLSPLSETERNFLKRAVAPLDYAKVIFVINMIDLLKEPDQITRAVESLRAKIQSMFPASPVFALSAMDECGKHTNEKRAESNLRHICESNFDEFRSYIHESILAFRELMQFEHGVLMMRDALTQIQAQAAYIQKATDGKHDTLVASVKDIESQLLKLDKQKNAEILRVQTALSAMQDETQIWMNEYLERIRQDIHVNLKAYSYEDVKKNYTFYINDVISIGLNACLSEHRDQLMQLLGQDKQDDVWDVFPPVGVDAGAFSFTPETWSRDTTAKMAIPSIVFNYLGAYAGFAIPEIVGGGINSILNKNVSEPEKLDAYQEFLLKNIPTLQQVTTDQVNFWHRSASSDIKAYLEDKYRSQEGQLRGILAQVQECLTQDDGKLANTTQYLGDVIGQTKNAIAELEDFREKIWPITVAMPAD